MIVGFDLAQRTGYAVLRPDGSRVMSGVINLGKRSGKSLDGFQKLIGEVLSYGVTAVSYEIVRRHIGVEAAHAYGGYESVLALTLHQYDIDPKCLHKITVQQIKRCATGSGKAEKIDMEAQVLARWKYIPEDHNEADALFCAEVCRRIISGGSV